MSCLSGPLTLWFVQEIHICCMQTERKGIAGRSQTRCFLTCGSGEDLRNETWLWGHRGGCLKPLPILHLTATSLTGWCSESSSAYCNFQSLLISSSAPAEEFFRKFCIRLHWVGRMEGGPRATHMCMNSASGTCMSMTAGEENACESKYLCEARVPKSWLMLWLMKHSPDATGPGRRTFNCMLSFN